MWEKATNNPNVLLYKHGKLLMHICTIHTMYKHWTSIHTFIDWNSIKSYYVCAFISAAYWMISSVCLFSICSNDVKSHAMAYMTRKRRRSRQKAIITITTMKRHGTYWKTNNNDAFICFGERIRKRGNKWEKDAGWKWGRKSGKRKEEAKRIVNTSQKKKHNEANSRNKRLKWREYN